MAMTTKVGDVVRLDSPHGSYRGKFTAGHIGVVTAIHAYADPSGGHQWVNLDDEAGSPLWNPTANMTMVADEGTLFEDMFEDMEHGDTLIAVKRNEEYNHLEAGKSFTALENDCGCCFHFEDSDGDDQFHWDNNFYFINLSAAKRDAEPVATAEVIPYPTAIFLDEGVERIAPPTPKYDDMDDAAKGSILLAAHEGKAVQFMSRMGNVWMDDTTFDPSENFAYRVKPQELIDAEEALNAATSNVVSLADARDAARTNVDTAVETFDTVRSNLATAEFDLASARDTVEALNAA